MLFLVGLGLSEKEIPNGTIEVCKKCDLYIDRFTSIISDSTTNKITQITGKEIKELSRKEMEEDAKEIIKKAAKKDIAILIGGDPLIATTHKILYIEAKKQGIETQVIHANSIMTTVIGESGLDFYRFGSICTIPKWTAHYSPVSFYEKIEKNLKNKEHSMLLLDYDAKNRITLNINDAINALDKAEEHYKKGIITAKTKIIILHNLSLNDSKVIPTNILNAKSMTEEGVNVIVLPAELTDIEKEAIEARTGTKW
jgi:diphthine synthase